MVYIILIYDDFGVSCFDEFLFELLDGCVLWQCIDFVSRYHAVPSFFVVQLQCVFYEFCGQLTVWIVWCGVLRSVLRGVVYFCNDGILYEVIEVVLCENGLLLIIGCLFGSIFDDCLCNAGCYFGDGIEYDVGDIGRYGECIEEFVWIVFKDVFG